MKVSRRSFITGSAAAGALTFLPRAQAEAAVSEDSFATLIDLTKCNGCEDKQQPLCVTACKTKRSASFPQPKKEHLRDYWPQKKHEDWSAKKHLIDRFTPYNWLFVQRIKVGDRTVSMPRRCMHCDNPPCAKLCPFGIKHKTAEGPVYINQDLCFGGAKCRTVCPWSVPQRQAGVGLYTLWQKFLPVGGGVMYKCDLCRERLLAGDTPFCIEACPLSAMEIGRRDVIMAKAKKLKEYYRGDLFGLEENGGTSTIYVSSIKFSEIDKSLEAETKSRKGGKTIPLSVPENMLKKQSIWAGLSLISPLLGVMAAFVFPGRNEEQGE